MRRPYLEDGRVVYRHPDGFAGLLSEYSYLARRLNVIANSVLKRTAGSVEGELNLDHPVFGRSLKTTVDLMRRVQETAGVPVVVFNAIAVPSTAFEATAFEALCARADLSCLPNLQPALIAAERAGQRVDGLPANEHWNANGHRIVGEAILRYLERQGLVGSHR